MLQHGLIEGQLDVEDLFRAHMACGGVAQAVGALEREGVGAGYVMPGRSRGCPRRPPQIRT